MVAKNIETSPTIGKICLQILLTISCLVIFSLLSITILIPVYILRSSTKLGARLLKSSTLYKMVSTRGAVFINVDDQNLYHGRPKMNIISTLVLEGVLELNDAKSYIQKYWITESKETRPELQQYLTKWCGFYFWAWDSNFNINSHVFELDWEAKYSVLNEETLVDINNELLTKPYKVGTSPWEFYLLHGTKGDVNNEINGNNIEDNLSGSFDNKTIIILRTHHSLADGTGIFKLLHSSALNRPWTQNVHQVHIQSNNIRAEAVELTTEKNSHNSMTFKKLIHKLLHPIKILLKIFQAVYEHAGIMLLPNDVNEFTTFPPDRLSWTLNAAVSSNLPLSYIKQLAAQTKTSVSSILYAGVVGGIRKFFQNHLNKTDELPNVISCCSPYPILGHSNKLRNYSSFCRLQLPLGAISSSSYERLLLIDNQLQIAKKSTQSYVMFYLMSFAGCLYPCLTKALSSRSPLSCHISNFRTVNYPTDIFGHTMESVWFSPANSGIGVTCISSNEHIRIVIGLDKAILPTHPNFAQLVLNYSLEEFKEILDCEKNNIMKINGANKEILV